MAMQRGALLTAVSVIGIVFGVMTIISGGAVLFGPDEARVKAGDYVPFVVWFNFVAGFFYVLAGYFLWKADRRGALLALGLALATAAVFAAFGIHVAMGGAFEMRTVVAMPFRGFLWLGIYFAALRSFRPAAR